MQGNTVSDTTNGSGIILRDVGIHVLSCKIERNNDDGIIIDSSQFPMPAKILQNEVRLFLKIQPMKIIIQDCEIYLNQKDGICIQEFWKGPIDIDECAIIGNTEYGIICMYKNSPILQQDDNEVLKKF